MCTQKARTQDSLRQSMGRCLASLQCARLQGKTLAVNESCSMLRFKIGHLSSVSLNVGNVLSAIFGKRMIQWHVLESKGNSMNFVARCQCVQFDSDYCIDFVKVAQGEFVSVFLTVHAFSCTWSNKFGLCKYALGILIR